MTWINFLHFYQPANIDGYHIKEATEKSCYRVLHPNLKFTINISGCLFLRWEELNYQDLINRFKKLYQSGQIEITGSAAYHGFLPLLPPEEIKRQIIENEDILSRFLEIDMNKKKPKGFFLPEMAYSPELAKLVKDFGYQWLILDEVCCGEIKKGVVKKDYQTVSNHSFESLVLDKASGLKVIFRDRKLSNCYVPEKILSLLTTSKEKNKEQIFITATDGELYGLRHEDPLAFLEKIAGQAEIKTMTISEYINEHNILKEVSLHPASWETTPLELKKNIPYALWSSPKNKIQKNLWLLALLAWQIVEKNSKDENSFWARWHLVRGLASCTFWWASAKDFRKVFGPLAWNPDEIERGMNELIRAVRSLEDGATRQDKLQAEKLYIKIKTAIWNKHWTKHWKK